MKTKSGLLLAVSALLVLVSVSRVTGFTDKYIIRSDSVGQDKWFGTYYVRNGENNDILKVGGWGDAYYTLIQMPVHFNVPGRKVIKKATLNLHSYGSYRPTPMTMYLAKTPWTETSLTDHWGLTINDHGSIPAPSEYGPYEVDISSEFFQWITAAEPNYGLLLVPNYNDNRFNYFLSSENTRVYGRPEIVVEYERIPSFKMPLPGNKYWKCTTGAGGSSTHLGANYYSVDFSFRHYDENLNLIENKTDIPVLAAADGVVIKVGGPSDPKYPYNGNFVIIDHDKDRKDSTGYQTYYLHLKDGTLAVAEGYQVKTGDLLGIMGNTGQSSGTHLHFQVQFEHQGSISSGADNVYLNFARVENSWAITDFDEGFFYQSKNTLWNF